VHGRRARPAARAPRARRGRRAGAHRPRGGRRRLRPGHRPAARRPRRRRHRLPAGARALTPAPAPALPDPRTRPPRLCPTPPHRVRETPRGSSTLPVRPRARARPVPARPSAHGLPRKRETMEQTIYRGLEGVNIDVSSICHIDGAKGELIYRGYDIRELANKASFEEVVHLLWEGELPTRAQLDAFKAEIARCFDVPQAVFDQLRALPRDVDPMHALTSAVALLGALDPQADDVGLENVKRIGKLLLAQFPTVVAAIQRARQGLEPVAPHPELSVAGNFLYMLTGEEPTAAATNVMDVALVLHAEHGSNASTFVARATASTLTDVYSAITAATSALKGPLHGGANEAVMEALERIGNVENVE